MTNINLDHLVERYSEIGQQARDLNEALADFRSTSTDDLESLADAAVSVAPKAEALRSSLGAYDES